mgnify:CR=1 FL=1
MARMSEFTFLSSDGQTALSAREYLPEGDPVGIVQIVHGIAEHIARYDAFAAFLAEHGYIVVLHDQLGHGKSAPDEAHLGFFSEENGWEKAVQDIRSLHDKTAAKYPGKPYFIFVPDPDVSHPLPHGAGRRGHQRHRPPESRSRIGRQGNERHRYSPERVNAQERFSQQDGVRHL